MQFRLTDGTRTYVQEIDNNETVRKLYDTVRETTGHDVYIFRSTPRMMIQNTDMRIADLFAGPECLYIERSREVKGSAQSAHESADTDDELAFSILVVPDDNSCLFHALSEVLSAKSSGALRKMVADAILTDPKAYAAYIEKDPCAYATWIVDANVWGGATEITIMSKIYKTKVCVIDREQNVIEFGEDYRAVVYLQYTGTHYNAVIAKDKSGNIVKKFARADKKVLHNAKTAVAAHFASMQ